MRFIRIFVNLTHLMIAFAVVLGIFWPQAEFIARILILPVLTILMTTTLLRFPGGFFKSPRKLLPGMLWGNFVNYLILGNLIILGGLLLIRDEKLWIGMILIAAVPAGVMVLPLGEKIKARLEMTLAGFSGTYIGALILTPIICLAFLKFIPVNYEKLIILVLTLIALPLMLSRIAVDRNWDEGIKLHEEEIASGCFLVLFYAMVVANFDWIRQIPREGIIIAALAFGIVVFINLLLLCIGRFFPIARETLSSLLLLATVKNYCLAGGIALYVFGGEAAVPALIFSVVVFLNAIWLKLRAEFSS